MNNKINTDRQQKIKEIVDLIMEIKTTRTPYDYLFRENMNEDPELNHKLLELVDTDCFYIKNLIMRQLNVEGIEEDDWGKQQSGRTLREVYSGGERIRCA